MEGLPLPLPLSQPKAWKKATAQAPCAYAPTRAHGVCCFTRMLYWRTAGLLSGVQSNGSTLGTSKSSWVKGGKKGNAAFIW